MLFVPCCLFAQGHSFNEEFHRLSGTQEWAALEKLAKERLIQFPRDPEALNALGIASVRLGRRAEALKAFQQATEVAPDKPEGWFNLGLAWAEKGDVSRVRDIGGKIRSLNKDLVNQFLNKDLVAELLVGRPLPMALPSALSRILNPQELPPKGSRFKSSGAAWIMLIVDERGIPTETFFLLGDPHMQPGAQEQGQSLRFEPLLREGKAVPFRFLLTIYFNRH